ncbi:MAG TPA: hypothetical protein VLJ61_14835 [Pyrinomonadaceae bacterium]|nr:hypothetical protein [Pyrinomonadaceae bacterium]
MSTQFERTGNPFPGLRPFDTDEYNLFFGRDGQSDELLARLGRTRFLAVVGTSGSGKSSLIRAGLVPALYGGLMAQTGSAWRIAVMRPGSDPVGNLARALSRDDVIGSQEVDDDVQATIIETTLRRSTLGLVDAVRQARLASYENVLVVVDQFEELFRFRSMREGGSEDDAAAFVKLLLEAPRQRDVSLYVVLTMRSDFLGDCAQFWGLPEAINEGQYLIPRMTRDERRSAITGPALVADAEISAPLVNRLLNDAGDNPDQLPILQHALMRTWDHWTAHRRDGDTLGLEDYEAVGTMTGALSRHAEEAFAELPDDRSRYVASSLFKALTERGPDNRETRRPTRLSDICAIAEASEEEVKFVVEVFRHEGRSFLMPPPETELTPDTVIDISHESLIRNWDRLKGWVRDEAEAARIYRRLAGAASDYRAGEVGLLDDVTLQWILKWKEGYKPNRAWGVRYHPGYDEAIGYLEESRAASEVAASERKRKQQEELERERREREQAESFAAAQARSARRLRWLMAALLVVLLFAIATAGFAVAAQRRAVNAQHQAETEQRNALALQHVAEQRRQEAAAALEEARVAKGDAEKSRDDAKTQADIAKRAEANAEGEKKRADDEARRAEQQATDALKAKTTAEQRARALEANGKFRDATIHAERGEFPEAVAMYDATIKGLQQNGVKDTEGVADTYVQLGQTHFGATQGASLTEGDNYFHVTQAVNSYDKAVKNYEDAGVNAKAADTLLSVGATLLKIANDVPVGHNVGSAGAELAALRLPTVQVAGGDVHLDVADEKAKLKNEALERYKDAFLLYRKAGNEDGMMQAAYRIGNFYLRDELPAWQDKTPTLDTALCNGRAQEYISNRQKALCYFKELERLSLARGKKDADIQRLLVWLGGINQEMGDASSAEIYFERVQQAFLNSYGDTQAQNTREQKAADALGWSDAAETAEDAGLYDTAIKLYAKASIAYGGAGNFYGQGQMRFKRGDLLRRHGDKTSRSANATSLAMTEFKNAIQGYRAQPQSNAALNGGSDEFFIIGSFAEDNYDENLALYAYNTALTLGEARHDELMQARALSGIASVQTQHDAEAARQFYMRSFGLYTKLREQVPATSNVPMPESDEYLKELGRIAAAVNSLDREISAKASADHQTPGADSLCPFPVIAYLQPTTATDGDTVTFSAYAVYPDMSQLKYEWTLSSPAATIVDQKLEPYPTIRVSTDGVGKGDLTATLVVSDGTGANACRQTVHATTKLAARPSIPTP